jgi:hypothetical protein
MNSSYEQQDWPQVSASDWDISPHPSLPQFLGWALFKGRQQESPMQQPAPATSALRPREGLQRAGKAQGGESNLSITST